MTREDLIFDSYLDPPEPEDPVDRDDYENRWCVMEDLLYNEAREKRLL